MRNILRDGGAQDLMAMQSINFSAGSGGVTNNTTPSIWPSKGVITSPFGSRVDPVTGAIGAFHEGVDIADDYGTPNRGDSCGRCNLCRLYRRWLW